MNDTNTPEACPFTPEELEIARRVAAWQGGRGGRAAKNTRSQAKLDALRLNRAKSDGRRPTKPDGIARAELRRTLERVLRQKPLTKDGPIGKVVNIMTSANSLHRIWPDVRNSLPPESVQEVADRLDDLLRALGGDLLDPAERTPATVRDEGFVFP